MCGCGAPLRPQGPPAWKASCENSEKNCRLWDLSRNLGFGVLASPQPHNIWRGHDELPRDIPQESRASSGGAWGALGASAAALTRRGCLRKTRARWRCTRIPSFPRTRGEHRPRRSACVRNPRRRPARRHTPERIPLRPPPRSTPRCPSRCVPPPRPPPSHPLVRRPGRARKPKSSRRSRLPSPPPAHPPPLSLPLLDAGAEDIRRRRERAARRPARRRLRRPHGVHLPHAQGDRQRGQPPPRRGALALRGRDRRPIPLRPSSRPARSHAMRAMPRLPQPLLSRRQRRRAMDVLLLRGRQLVRDTRRQPRRRLATRARALRTGRGLSPRRSARRDRRDARRFIGPGTRRVSGGRVLG